METVRSPSCASIGYEGTVPRPLEMKLLFISPFNCVPPNSGNKNLTFNLLKYLTTKLAVDLVVLEDAGNLGPDTGPLIEKALPNLNALRLIKKPEGAARVMRQISYLTQGYHPALGRYASDELKRLLERAGANREYDVAHFDMIHVAPYRAYLRNTPALLVASDAYSLAAERAIALYTRSLPKIRGRIEYRLIRHFERTVYPTFDVVATVSEVDAAYLRGTVQDARVQTIGIGLSDEFQCRTIRHLNTSDFASHRILCTGSLDHEVVAQGVCEFLEVVAARETAAELLPKITVLGRNPHVVLRRLLKRLPAVAHVPYADDYAAYLDRDWTYVYPQRCGSGLQTKLQQAMAQGLPTVGFASSFAGLRVTSGTHAVICDSMDAIVEAVAMLSKAPDLRRQIGARASAHVRKEFASEAVGEGVMELYRSICRRRDAASAHRTSNAQD